MQRCSDVAYASNGTALALEADNARYHARTRLLDADDRWSSWSSWDWFETSPGSITIALPDRPVVDLPPVVGSGTTSSTSTVLVTTTDPNGYTLRASGMPDNWGLRSSTGDELPRWTGSGARPTPWPVSEGPYFGMSVVSATGGKDTGRWGTGASHTNYSNLNYVGLGFASPVLLHTHGAAATDHEIVTSYRATIDANQPPGQYTTTTTYTVTANP